MSPATSPPAASSALPQPTELLQRALESDRIHSAYLLSGPGEAPLQAALDFARGLVCSGTGARPCGDCRGCRISSIGAEPIEIDPTGKRGPEFRHIGDHPDLFWVERSEEKTRILVGQVRAVQKALHLRSNEGGWRAVVIADADALNQEGQNGLLKLLEEPPPRTCLILVSASPAGLLATIRSRCQRAIFPVSTRSTLRDEDLPEERRSLVTRFDAISAAGLADLLDWAEEYRGNRATAAEKVHALLEVGSEWLRERVLAEVREGNHTARARLDAFKALAACRRDLVQRNANPVMVAERALIAVRESVPSSGGAAR